MKRSIPAIFLFVIYILFSLYGKAQTGSRITNISIKLVENNLVIGYDILEYEKEDLFTVWLEVTDSTEKRLKARSLSGDIGDDIKGGKGKIIEWNLEKDSIILNENIYIEVKAENTYEPGILAETKPDFKLADESEETEAKERTEATEIKTGVLLVKSAVYPGWGNSAVSSNKTYLLLGVAGYGSIATSIVFNRKAITAYDNYRSDTEANSERNDELFNQAVNYANYSRAFGYAALAIWIVDLTLVTVKAARQHNTSAKGESRIEINTSYSYLGNCPVVSLNYRF